MPTFTKCMIESGLNGLSKGATDDLVVNVLKKAIQVVIENGKTHDAYIAKERESAKDMISKMEERLAKIKESNYIPNPYLVPEIKAGLDLIKRTYDSAKQSGVDLMAAHAQYRGEWDKTAKAKLKDKNKVNGYQSMRLQTINDNKKSVSLAQRIGEYVSRGELIYKEAVLLTTSKKDDAKEMAEEIGALMKKIAENETEIDKLVIVVKGKSKTLRDNDNTATIPLKMYPVLEGYGKHIAAARKDMSGTMKTLRLQVDLLKKMAASNAAVFKAEIDKANKALAWQSEVDAAATMAQNAINLLPGLKLKAKGGDA